jgi:hypothetical protein
VTRRPKLYERKAAITNAVNCLDSSLRKSGDQLFHIRDSDAGDRVAAFATMERPVASGRNVPERGCSRQFGQERIEKRRERLPGVLARFIPKSAKACPDRRAPAGTANLNRFTLEDQEGARIRARIRVRRRTDIGYEALCTRGERQRPFATRDARKSGAYRRRSPSIRFQR